MKNDYNNYDYDLYCNISAERLNDFDVVVSNDKPPAAYPDTAICAHRFKYFKGTLSLKCEASTKGRYLSVRMRDQGSNRILTLCEVEFFTGRGKSFYKSTRKQKYNKMTSHQ